MVPLVDSICGRVFCGFVFLLALSVVTASKHKCDFSKCLSPQLKGASKSRDKQTVCRLLAPTVHCLITEEPVCRKELGRGSHLYTVFVKNLDVYKKQYAELCDTYYTTCKEVVKCLHPQLQKASHKQDITFLCNNVHTVIACFENAIHICRERKKSKYNDANFNLIESYLDRIRLQASARCDASSLLFGRTSQTLSASLLAFFVILFHKLQGNSLTS